ncbi:MAG: hypothetical protein Q8L37_03835 [Candidatus Gottesmanbacteria bacterium]|nr:hypothetical protein [Candidatus Gottesmanbacteria bacterium]
MLQTTVTAMEARKRFGELLNSAFYHGVSTIIERKGKAIAKVVPIVHANAKLMRDAPDARTVAEARARLKGSVIKYINPFEPVGLEDWEALK